MSLRWKKLAATTSSISVRRGAIKPPESRQCHLHLVRAETAPNANGGKQLALLLRVQRGVNAWLVVRTAAQLVELHTQVSARCASASTVPKLPKLPDLNSRAGAGRSPPEAGEASGEVDHLPVSLDPHVAHKIQEFLRRLVGGFHGPEVEAFVSIDTPPSRTLNQIEAWLFGPEAEKGVSKQGEMSEYNARDKQWEPWYFVLRGSSLLKYRSARLENDPASVYELGTAATTRAATEHQPAAAAGVDSSSDSSDRERYAFELEYNGKTRRLACASKQKADQWIDAFNQLNTSDTASSSNNNSNARVRRNVVFAVELRRVVHLKNDPWWRLSGPNHGQGASFITCGAAQYVDELAGFLLAAGKGKEGLFDQLPATELVQQVRDGDSVDYEVYQQTPEKVAGLLLVFLHQLPAPLIPFEFYDSFVAAFRMQEEKKRKKVVKLLLSLLPSLNLKVLRLMVGFLAHFLATLPKNSGSAITSAFAGVILRPLCYGDVASYAAAATPRLLELLMTYRHKFWDYEEGFGAGEAKPSRAAGSLARTKSAAEIRPKLKRSDSRVTKAPNKDKIEPKVHQAQAQNQTQAKAVEADKNETESSRAARSGTLDLFAQMAQGAATMQKSTTATPKSPAAKRRERRKRSLTFHKEPAASPWAATPSLAAVSSPPPALRRLTKSNTVDFLERKKPAAALDKSDEGGPEGEATGPKATTLGTAAKRRERRKRSLTRERLQSTPASDEPSPGQLLVGAVHAVRAGLTMNARLAEIARLKQQRMGLENVVKANDAPANGKSYRDLGGGSMIEPHRPKHNDEDAGDEEEGEKEKDGMREVVRPDPAGAPLESPKLRSPFLRELQMNSLARHYQAKCVEVTVAGEEREKMGFDPSQQAEQMGALRSWNVATTRS